MSGAQALASSHLCRSEVEKAPEADLCCKPQALTPDSQFLQGSSSPWSFQPSTTSPPCWEPGVQTGACGVLSGFVHMTFLRRFLISQFHLLKTMSMQLRHVSGCVCQPLGVLLFYCIPTGNGLLLMSASSLLVNI